MSTTCKPLLVWLFACAVFFVLRVSAAAELPRVVNERYLVDKTGTLTIDDVRALDNKGDFTPSDGNRVNFGYSKFDHWFRITVTGADAGGWMALELSNPRLGEVTLYAVDQNGVARSASTGVRRPFWHRELPGLSPAFPVEVIANEAKTYYLCVKNYGALRFDLRLWSLSEHNRHANFVMATALLVAGALMVLALYNLCIFVHLRQPGYLWIGLFLVSCTIWQMAASGTANMFLWPDSTVWSRHALLLTGVTTLFIGTCMSNVLLDTSRFAPRIGRLNVVIGLITLACALLTLLNSRVALYATLFGGLVIPVTMAGLALYTMRLGSRAGQSFLYSWGLVLIGCVINSLLGPGYLPANWFTLHFMDFALLGACLGWSFALTGRLKVHEREQRRMLEQRVEERTAELQSALDAVKTLHGLLPICSCCKKIRDDHGYWQHVETYLQEHTDADFSHGICPDCAHTHYPEYFPRREVRAVLLEGVKKGVKEEPSGASVLE